MEGSATRRDRFTPPPPGPGAQTRPIHFSGVSVGPGAVLETWGNISCLCMGLGLYSEITWPWLGVGIVS